MDRRVVEVVAVLERTYASPPSVRELADAVGVSACHLQHLFKRELRVSLTAFIRQRRLDAAAVLLATSDEYVSQIGVAVGIHDPANFNHAFKRQFGVAPGDYRARAQDRPKHPQDRPICGACSQPLAR